MLTYDQLQCIGAVISTHGSKFQHLVDAIDTELEQVRKDQTTCPAPQEREEAENHGVVQG